MNKSLIERMFCLALIKKLPIEQVNEALEEYIRLRDTGEGEAALFMLNWQVPSTLRKEGQDSEDVEDIARVSGSESEYDRTVPTESSGAGGAGSGAVSAAEPGTAGIGPDSASGPGSEQVAGGATEAHQVQTPAVGPGKGDPRVNIFDPGFATNFERFRNERKTFPSNRPDPQHMRDARAEEKHIPPLPVGSSEERETGVETGKISADPAGTGSVGEHPGPVADDAGHDEGSEADPTDSVPDSPVSDLAERSAEGDALVPEGSDVVDLPFVDPKYLQDITEDLVLSENELLALTKFRLAEVAEANAHQRSTIQQFRSIYIQSVFARLPVRTGSWILVKPPQGEVTRWCVTRLEILPHAPYMLRVEIMSSTSGRKTMLPPVKEGLQIFRIL